MIVDALSFLDDARLRSEAISRMASSRISEYIECWYRCECVRDEHWSAIWIVFCRGNKRSFFSYCQFGIICNYGQIDVLDYFVCQYMMSTRSFALCPDTQLSIAIFAKTAIADRIEKDLILFKVFYYTKK